MEENPDIFPSSPQGARIKPAGMGKGKKNERTRGGGGEKGKDRYNWVEIKAFLQREQEEENLTQPRREGGRGGTPCARIRRLRS